MAPAPSTQLLPLGRQRRWTIAASGFGCKTMLRQGFIYLLRTEWRDEEDLPAVSPASVWLRLAGCGDRDGGVQRHRRQRSGDPAQAAGCDLFAGDRQGLLDSTARPGQDLLPPGRAA